MINVKRDFQERCDEINSYFEFLEKVITRNGKILYSDDKSENLNPILVKTLKANGFLLLYNLAESSIKQAIQAIFEEIIRDNVKYEDAKEEIRKEFVKFMKKINTENFVFSVNNLSEDLISYCLSVKQQPTDTQPQYIKELFSGNVHAKTIRSLAEKYGFSFATNPKLTNNGRALQTVKDKRNDLAHGVFSFQAIGKEYTETDLIKMKEQVLAYLEQILDNIEDYINKKEFLK